MQLTVFRINNTVKILSKQIWEYSFKCERSHCVFGHNLINNLNPQRKFSMDKCGVDLSEVVSQLNSFAATSLAESWDNVGLLIEPYTVRKIQKILLTNDLTEAVMQEAVEKNVEMIISYHPPIFTPLKSITKRSWKERVVAACLEKRIALYSPHTSFDAVKGGVNDWLASAFDAESISPLLPSKSAGESSYLADLSFQKPECDEETLKDISAKASQSREAVASSSVKNVGVSPSGDSNVCLKISASMLPKVMSIFKVSGSTKITIPECGMGRLCHLKSPQPVKNIVDIVKKHVKVSNLRLAIAVGKSNDSVVSSVALCAGSGASVLRGVKADLYLTGEMSHHEVLDAVHCGSHVILCEHSNSERGFLTHFAFVLADTLLSGRVQVLVSVADADPLQVV